MRCALFVVTALLSLCAAGPCSSQNWSTGSSTGVLSVECTLSDGVLALTLVNPPSAPGAQSVLGWSVEPFNLPAPAGVVCPEGWTWRDDGWKQFEIADASRKYEVGGPALEPGESLRFVYVLGDGSTPVNNGGPAGGAPAFLAHVGAIGGQVDGLYAPVMTERGATWFDRPRVLAMAVVPELPGSIILFLTFFVLACLERKRPGV